MNSSTKIYCFFFLFVFVSLYSQQENSAAIQVIKKAAAVYNKQEYVSNNSKYTLYLDFTSNKIHEQYAGVVLKKNNVSYFKIKNTEFVSFGTYGAKINNDQKAIVIEKQPKEVQDSPLSMTHYLKGFDSKLIQENKDYFICELTPSKVSQVMLTKVIIQISKKDYSIVKQTLFFVNKMESKNANGKTVYSIPRLEIVFSSREKNIKKDDLLVAKENYFTLNGNQIILSKRLAAYQLFKS